MNSPISNSNDMRVDDEQDVIDLFGMFRAMWHRKWVILGLATIVSLATSFWMGTKPAVYGAKATLLFEDTQASVVSIQDLYRQGEHSTGYMQTQFELLRSRAIAERVVRKLQLQNMEKFKPQPPPPKPWYEFDLSTLKPAGSNPQPAKPWVMPSEEARIQDLTDMVAGGVKVEQIGESNLVSLTYTSDDPKLAASIANTYLEQFIDSFLAAKVDSTLKATDWLNTRLADLKQNLKNSEEKLQNFREREKLVDLQGVTTNLSAQQISNINNTYTQSQQRRRDLEATQKELEHLKTVDELMTIPLVLNHDSIRALKQKESDSQRNLSELSRRYGPKHPKIVDAKAQLASIRSALEAEVHNVVFGLQREYRLALESENSSKSQLDATKLDLQDLNRKEFILKDLEREVDTNSQLYNIFFTRIKETGEAGVFEAPPARIIDLSLGGSKIGPNVQQAVMVAFGLSFLFGCALAVLVDLLDNTLKSPTEVEDKLRVPVLGTLPVMQTSKEGHSEEYWLDSKSDFAEAVRTIRTGVVLSGLDNPARLIVVTSSVPGEGKSTIALNLAASLAQMEKTLVIGADLRRPSLARKCNFPAKHPGLSNYVAGSAALDDCIIKFGNDQLSVMPAGIVPSNPLEMLSSQKFRDTLELLQTKYDRIVIDSAPVAAVSDALMLASYADAVIFVIKSDATATALVKKSITQLENVNAPLTGVVLNHFDPAKLTKYYGNYNYGYRYGGDSYNYTTNDTHG